MKLFARYNRINLLAIAAIFLLAGITYYFLLRYILVRQVDNDLQIEQHEIITYAGKHGRLPEIVAVRDQQTSYKPVGDGNLPEQFSTIRVREQHEKEAYRQLCFVLQADGQWYEIVVRKSLEGTDELLQSIVTVTILTILLILLAGTIINRVVLKKLWQPFYTSLDAMRRFEIGDSKVPSFPDTDTDEFQFMNESLHLAATKANRDYLHLREFTENASHELQTPIAIIRSKLDLLIQEEQLSESQSRLVQSAYVAIQRLTRINQGLLLLTKIENGQFTDTQRLDMLQLIEEKKQQFEEMLHSQDLQLTVNAEPGVYFELHPLLADSILNNLFSNAIRYNRRGGEIRILLTGTSLQFSNTGVEHPLDAERLFKRFAGQHNATQGIGLGLAIIRHSAESSGFRASYHYSEGMHHFILEKS